ncbi:cysteine hydrolase family protein [Pseudomonas aeruginosa]|uniref:cysteine hydrolase family protein n=1 Tax=Pseudomonas aeruginosa TaxID=287 RepID=UPI00053D377B|nr:cysteine hydrolase family protein [Pseudomonas aeruginosa]
MSKQAVVVVDLQNEYLPTGKLALVGVEQAVANAARIIGAARNHGDLVVHIRHEFVTPGVPFFVPGTEGVEIIEAVAPKDGEPVILKNYPNSFLKTDLQKVLADNGIQKLTVIGAMSHMCIDATTRAASDLGYEVTVVDDACATRDLEFRDQVVPAAQVHATLMSALGFAYATILTTQEYLRK